MNRRRLLRRLLDGSLNVSFDDLINLAEGFGFRPVRIRGSHHIPAHRAIPELLNLQPRGEQAKPYQVRQFLKLVELHNLELEDEP